MSLAYTRAPEVVDRAVIAVTGHRRLTTDAERTLEETLRELWSFLSQEWSRTGRKEASPFIANGLAAGADLAFAETRRAHFPSASDWHVLPCPPATFEASLFDGLGLSPEDAANIRRRYRQAANGAAARTILSGSVEPPTSASYAALARWMVSASDGLLAYWDGKEPRGEGGSGHVVALARERSLPILHVMPDGGVRGDGAIAGEAAHLPALARQFVDAALERFYEPKEQATQPAGE